MLPTRIRGGVLALVTLVPLLGACGDDEGPTDPITPTGEAFGTLAAVVHDSSAVLPPGRTEPPPTDSVFYTGVLSGSAQIEVFSDGLGWTSVGDTAHVDFAVYCREAAVVESGAQVAADSYSEVRLTLREFSAVIDSGAVVAGVTIDSAFVISFGSVPVVIQKSITPLSVTEGSSTSIIFDLNTELWLDEGVVAVGVADTAEVAAATNVIIR